MTTIPPTIWAVPGPESVAHLGDGECGADVPFAESVDDIDGHGVAGQAQKR